MRTRLTLIPTLLALAIALPLAGCGDGNNDNIFIGTTPTPGGSNRTPTPVHTSTPVDGVTATPTVVEGATATETPPAEEPTATPTPSGPACQAGDQITVTETVDKSFGGLRTELKYSASVTLPGSGNTTDKTRVTGTPSGGILQVNDSPTTSGIDDTLTLGYVDTSDHPAGTFAIIAFDCVEGAPAPTAGDFTCTVASASTSGGNPITDATCTLTVTGP